MSSAASRREPRYTKIRELGHNLTGGRVTYLAKDNTTEQLVVIKQFQFAQGDTDWSGYKAYEREIQVLQSLQYPSIPRYLNSFETRDGFCLVQEYKAAEPLSASQAWTTEDVRQIAIATLDILIDLQTRLPPVIHRDIKPENILVDEHLNVYLIDFGFARMGGGEGAMSSMAAGTLGFMAPEQIYNRELGLGTDLYGLGATLICVLAGLKSTEIDTLMDDVGRFHLEPHLSELDPQFLAWLNRMVQPKPRDRYASAAAAKAALLSPGSEAGVSGIPTTTQTQSTTDQGAFPPTVVELKATNLGDRVSHKIILQPPETAPNAKTPQKQGAPTPIIIPHTDPTIPLQGRWDVLPHPNDPPHTPDAHAWITITPRHVDHLPAECTITVDTCKLVGDRVYTRQLRLRTQTEPPDYPVTLNLFSGASKPLIQGTANVLLIAIVVAWCLGNFAGNYLLSSYNPLWSSPISFWGSEFWYQVDSVPVLKLGWFVTTFIGMGLWSWMGIFLGKKIGRISSVLAWIAAGHIASLAAFSRHLWMCRTSFQSDLNSIFCEFTPFGYGRSLLVILGVTSNVAILGALWISLAKEYKRVGFSDRFSKANAGLVVAASISIPIGLLFMTNLNLIGEAEKGRQIFFLFLALSLGGLISAVVLIKRWVRQMTQIYLASLPKRIQP